MGHRTGVMSHSLLGIALSPGFLPEVVQKEVRESNVGAHLQTHNPQGMSERKDALRGAIKYTKVQGSYACVFRYARKSSYVSPRVMHLPPEHGLPAKSEAGPLLRQLCNGDEFFLNWRRCQGLPKSVPPEAAPSYEHGGNRPCCPALPSPSTCHHPCSWKAALLGAVGRQLFSWRNAPLTAANNANG